MKAILVIDMPKECRDCIYASKSTILDGNYICKLINDGILIDGRYKRNDCPLKPMPHKLDYEELSLCIEYSEERINGWNDCIDEILKETE